MQVEVCVAVAEQVERLVRCAHLMREDSDKQQNIREVLRAVSRDTQHGWSNVVGLVGKHVQEETQARSEASTGVSAGNENQKWVKH